MRATASSLLGVSPRSTSSSVEGCIPCSGGRRFLFGDCAIANLHHVHLTLIGEVRELVSHA